MKIVVDFNDLTQLIVADLNSKGISVNENDIIFTDDGVEIILDTVAKAKQAKPVKKVKPKQETKVETKVETETVSDETETESDDTEEEFFATPTEEAETQTEEVDFFDTQTEEAETQTEVETEVETEEYDDDDSLFE